jgi:hypothetical protein
LRHYLSDVAANDGSRNRAGKGTNREGLLFGRPGGPVSQNHVAEFVRHDARWVPAYALSTLERRLGESP